MSFIAILIAGGIFSLMGIMFVVIVTIIKKYFEGVYMRCTSQTQGTVDGVWKHYFGPDRNDMRSYYPIYKYIVDGKEYNCRSAIGTYSPAKISNDVKTIYYNPNNPSECYSDKGTNDGIMKLFKVLGTIFLSIGILLLILYFVI